MKSYWKILSFLINFNLILGPTIVWSQDSEEESSEEEDSETEETAEDDSEESDEEESEEDTEEEDEKEVDEDEEDAEEKVDEEDLEANPKEKPQDKEKILDEEAEGEDLPDEEDAADVDELVGPEDSETVEENTEGAVNPQEPVTPDALRSDVEIPAMTGDSETDLTELFYRIPLKPPMSSSNWRRFAGPSLAKIYRINQGDNLWLVSQRLFGSPYLWPKVWQLNANLGNPNVIEKGIDLEFLPGNPNSAPTFALRGRPGDDDLGPLPPLIFRRLMTPLEEVQMKMDYSLRQEGRNFTEFYVPSLPSKLGNLPAPIDNERMHFLEGDVVRYALDEGEERDIIRVSALNEIIFVQVLGRIKGVGEYSVVTELYTDMMTGDWIAKEDFKVQPMQIEEGPELSSSDLYPVAFRAVGFSSPFTASGIKTSGQELSEGQLVTIADKDKGVSAKAVVIKSSPSVATVWLLESDREIP